MSFVSFIGNENFISIVGDTRVSFNGHTYKDNSSNFRMVYQNILVSLTGIYENHEQLYQQIEDICKKYTTLKRVFEEIRKLILAVPTTSNQKIACVAVGFKHKSALLLSIKNNASYDQLVDFHDGLLFTVMNPPETNHDYSQELSNQLNQLTSFTLDNLLKIQEEVLKKAASQCIMVNSTIQQKLLINPISN